MKGKCSLTLAVSKANSTFTWPKELEKSLIPGVWREGAAAAEKSLLAKKGRKRL